MAGLTLSVIFDGMSLNYGESVGNVSEVKKLTRRDKFFSYLSRQALRYELYRTMKELHYIDNGREEPLTNDKGVIQFKDSANIKDYIEVDLFGYMRTKGGETSDIRPAVVRVSPAVSLEPMKLDTEFGTNLNFAQRTGGTPNPFQFEHHSSLYAYTLTVELDRVGVDKDIRLEPQERADRVCMLLDAVKFLTRNIKGRMENLSPIFAIGGVYPVKNPFFMGRLRIFYDENGYYVDTKLLKSVLETELKDGEKILERSRIGMVEGYFLNEKDIKSLIQQDSYDLNNLFNNLKSKVKEYYRV
ncbi:MAG: type I-B CRISPR-associated protein Cas7/Cst2/DevR [Caldimicrobium sp.]|nr:type I-B CRISPR-associated protein Cas7/Cst2/DevR [Caldimicrobium sp.]